jgi:hypothetical protein
MKLQSLLHTYAMNCNFLCETTHTLVVKVVFGFLKIYIKLLKLELPIPILILLYTENYNYLKWSY